MATIVNNLKKTTGIGMASPTIMLDVNRVTALIRYSAKVGDKPMHMFRQLNDGNYFVIGTTDQGVAIEDALRHIDIRGLGAPVVSDLSRTDHELLADFLVPEDEKALAFYTWENDNARGGAIAAATIHGIDDDGNVELGIQAIIISNENKQIELDITDESHITIAGPISGDEPALDTIIEAVAPFYELGKEIVLDALEYGVYAYDCYQNEVDISDDVDEEEDEDDEVDDAFMSAFPNGGFKHKKHKKEDSFDKILRKMGAKY